MSMTPEPLQGSLFGEIASKNKDQKTRSSELSSPNDGFSDETLVKDAKKRPRERTSIKSESKNSIDGLRSSKKSNKQNHDESISWSHHSLVNLESLTPVLKHYVELKKSSPERFLLYRLGDFYECFFEDAIEISRLLEITLTGKEGGKAIGRVPMAGIPHHAAERYCSELIKKGHSVAICDQLEDSPSKGSLIKREITRVLTPGTVIEEGMLQARKNNWLAAVIINFDKKDKSQNWGLAIADVSTGDFLVIQSEGSSSLLQELNKIDPSELIYCEDELSKSKSWCPDNIELKIVKRTPFSLLEAEKRIKDHYQLATITGTGLTSYPLALRACGGLLNYLQNTNPIETNRGHFTNSRKIPLDIPKLKLDGEVMVIDSQTRRNLEITSTQKDGQFQGSLLWAIDRTLTAMGGRCIRRWIEEPLIDVIKIKERQDIVSYLIELRPLRKSIQKLLRAMGDLERLAGRAGAGQAGARDLIAIAEGIERLPLLSAKLKGIDIQGPQWLNPIINIDKKLIKISQSINNTLVEYPALGLNEGGLIHDGVDSLLDGIRNKLDDQDCWLKNQEFIEQKNSKITNLRIQYHRTFGYFFAVSRAKSSSVPDHWIRRQTLANEERFVTPELKAREGKIFQLKSRAYQKEYEIFCHLRSLVGEEAERIRIAARAIAGLDAMTSLAEIAAEFDYCKPTIYSKEELNNSRKISIKGCRHPVVEQLLADKDFISNDILIGDKTDLIVLTGPNASGKSCYLRQIGLIQLLSQIGSWVPAEKTEISIADRIFTRVGAVDDLSSGQSTFMVEMTETASILNNATSNSLVLLDEIGRGTATFDGLSIAWAVSEFLADKVRSRTIFATHYHELNQLEKVLPNVANFQVLVKETGEDLIFLHKVVSGGASRSYGIEAARLAGVPKEVILRANQILDNIQNNNHIKDSKKDNIKP